METSPCSQVAQGNVSPVQAAWEASEGHIEIPGNLICNYKFFMFLLQTNVQQCASKDLLLCVFFLRFSPFLSFFSVNLCSTEVLMCSDAQRLVFAWTAWFLQHGLLNWRLNSGALLWSAYVTVRQTGLQTRFHTHISFLLSVTHIRKPLHGMWMGSIQVASVTAFTGTNKTQTRILLGT